MFRNDVPQSAAKPRPREPLSHGRSRPRPVHAARPSYHIADENGIFIAPEPPGTAPHPVMRSHREAARMVAGPQLEPREPISRPCYPPRPVLSSIVAPPNVSLESLTPSQRLRLRRLL